MPRDICEYCERQYSAGRKPYPDMCADCCTDFSEMMEELKIRDQQLEFNFDEPTKRKS